MSKKGKHSGDEAKSNPGNATRVRSTDHNQLDFELDFFAAILLRNPDYIDVLRVQGNNLTLKGRFAEGLQIDKRLVELRPSDPLAHYNLACSFSLLKKIDLGLRTLRRAMELGYRDFRYIREDRDLDCLRQDPRFRQLLREFESR